MHVGFARVIWAEYIAGYFITDRRCAPEARCSKQHFMDKVTK